MFGIVLIKKCDIIDLTKNNERCDLMEVPDYFQYLNWYDLDTPTGLYWFMQELINDDIDLDEYPEIKTYYEILLKNVFLEEPNMISVEYVMRKLKKALVAYGFAHTTKKVEYKLYYYWFMKGD